MNNISDIKHGYYINLNHRVDRKIYVETQLDRVGLHAERFNAIQLENRALGCSMSHLKCLENAKKNNWDHVLIVEDDITFLNPDLFIKQLNLFLQNHKEWDLILLAGNNMPPYQEIDNTCVKVTKCQTTTGYIVKKHYFDILINNYHEGINKLLNNPTKRCFYAIDRYWFSLQSKDNWYLIIPLSVVQKEDYSDIEKRNTNYISAMLDLNKKQYFANLNTKINFQKNSNINLYFA
jgi:GR25 family glycosyltransferase involved in LPS biosynthesis